MSDVFKAIADTTRREILLMLAQQPTNVNEIAEKFQVSRPAISRHIKVLRDCNLISVESDKVDGRQINCYAQLEALAEVEAYISKLESFWKSKLKGLGSYLDKQKEEGKE
ncbi:MAG: metalloregulator ArsR/SmtB family transcription factor [Bacteroidota bacterium]